MSFLPHQFATKRISKEVNTYYQSKNNQKSVCHSLQNALESKSHWFKSNSIHPQLLLWDLIRNMKLIPIQQKKTLETISSFNLENCYSIFICHSIEIELRHPSIFCYVYLKLKRLESKWCNSIQWTKYFFDLESNVFGLKIPYHRS